MSENNGELIKTVVKVSSMVIMFLMILIVGLIPIKSKAFKSNQKLLSLTGAFSGGLFISVGLIHLLPEAQDQILKHYEEIGDTSDHFPIVYLVTILSFTLILWIEKIATGGHAHDSHSDSEIQKVFIQDSCSEVKDPLLDNIQTMMIRDQSQEDLSIEEKAFKQVISTHNKIALKASFSNAAKQDNKGSFSQKKMNQLAPYILQIAIGIHAVFEGLAIGIEQDTSACLGIAVAVVCHKWAEGLTLGLAFRQAEVDVNIATAMIVIQAIMNPIGIGLGWVLSSQGLLVTSIFESISAGTFIYIATIEVIVEEFNIARYRWLKFVFFCFAIAFISSIWYLEKLTES